MARFDHETVTPLTDVQMGSVFFGSNVVWVILLLFAVTLLHMKLTATLFGHAIIKPEDHAGLIMAAPNFVTWTNPRRSVKKIPVPQRREIRNSIPQRNSLAWVTHFRSFSKNGDAKMLSTVNRLRLILIAFFLFFDKVCVFYTTGCIVEYFNAVFLGL